jgi:hypothetical protein
MQIISNLNFGQSHFSLDVHVLSTIANGGALTFLEIAFPWPYKINLNLDVFTNKLLPQELLGLLRVESLLWLGESDNMNE